MSFLNLDGKKVLIIGVANKKSVAYRSAKVLQEAGAKLVFSVRDETTFERCRKLFPDDEIHICDVEKKEDIKRLSQELKKDSQKFHGIVHSIAFADYSDGFKPFHETTREQFLQAIQISAFSLVEIVNELKDIIDENGSVVTISISTTEMTAEPYGFMAPVKAALDSSVCFLAKSFSAFSNRRFNAVKAGLLKTSASAGIPGYLDYYLFSEKATLRGRGITTKEVANCVAFLISERSSGINAQGIVVDGGMRVNYFDKDIVKKISEI